LDDPDHRDLNPYLDMSTQVSVQDFAWYLSFAFNTWINLAYCPQCIDADVQAYLPDNRKPLYFNKTVPRTTYDVEQYILRKGWFALYLICTAVLFIAGVSAILLESRTVAPDVLGYASNVARNSRYLTLPKTYGYMSGSERARKVGGVEVMIQDVNAKSDVGKIALGRKHEAAVRLKPDRVYR